MSNMNAEQFMEACGMWYEIAVKLAAAHHLFTQTKHELEVAKGNAWADGQVTGVNADARKAALYIIVEPFKESLITAEKVLMDLTVEEHYWRTIVDFSVWNGINNPTAWQGIRKDIDHYKEREGR